MTARTDSFKKERLYWAAGTLVMMALLMAVLVSSRWNAGAVSHAVSPMHQHGATASALPGRPAIAQTAQRCRQGAFLEADRMLGSLLTLHQTLPNTLPDAARNELDSLLYTALQQARSEVHCVAGVLTHGYDKAFAQTVTKAAALARQRGLSADVAAIGDEVVQILERNILVAGLPLARSQADSVPAMAQKN